MTYKVIHYAEVFGNTKIESGVFYYLLDKLDTYNLIHIEKVVAVE
jgi:hypothetical protein